MNKSLTRNRINLNKTNYVLAREMYPRKRISDTQKNFKPSVKATFGF